MEALPVTVVIPAHRCETFVARAVRSALEQQPPPAEVVVVADGAADDTAERARAAGARVLELDPARGAAGARNAGMSEAGGAWVALLDCDDEWLPGHLAALWDARGSHVLVSSAALGFGPLPEHHRVHGWAGRRPRLLRGPQDAAVPENPVRTSGVLLRRDVAEAAGGFRREHEPAEDLDLWLRMLEHGTGVVLPAVTTVYRRHSSQASDDARGMWTRHSEVLGAYAGRPWRTASLLRRHEGVVAWDSARSRLAGGAPRARTLAGLARTLADPRRALGVAQLLAMRRAQRAAAAKLERRDLSRDSA
jgi:glycosyltransferase involved in cell wall biosynthesis